MSEWQPIDTAPRDGTNVILFTHWKGDAASPDPFDKIQIGFWEDGYEDPEGWFTREAGWQTETIGDATHWMPLPEPPCPTPAT